MEQAFIIYCFAIGLVFFIFATWLIWQLVKAKKPKNKKPSHPVILTDQDIDGDLWS